MLREVEPVADNELIGHFKAAVINLNVNLATARLVEERANLDAVGFLVHEVIDEEVHSRAGINDVLDKQEVASFGVVVEVFEDIDFAAGVRVCIVA